jgi:hypothetical protein
LIYSDDGKITAGGVRPERKILLHLYVLVVLRVPLAWKKVKGGNEVEWIGYWLDMRRFEMGISELRACWAARWLTDRATEGRVALGELREALGRLVFVAGPIEYIRPFLGPLFTWAAAGPRFACPWLPVMIRLIMRYLATEIMQARTTTCARRSLDMGEVFRLDAKAEGDTVAIGGWKTSGEAKASKAPWFAISLTRVTAPWAFARGEPFRTIASLELLAALVGLIVLTPELDRYRDSAATISMSCGTDNKGNTHLLDRMLTTKYPLGIVLMELAHQMRLRRVMLRAHWLPRLENEEADALTNMDFRHFDQSKRIEVELKDLKFGVLDRLFETGEDYIGQVESIKRERKLRRESGEGPSGSRVYGGDLEDRPPRTPKKRRQLGAAAGKMHLAATPRKDREILRGEPGRKRRRVEKLRDKEPW